MLRYKSEEFDEAIRLMSKANWTEDGEDKVLQITSIVLRSTEAVRVDAFEPVLQSRGEFPFELSFRSGHISPFSASCNFLLCSKLMDMVYEW